MTFREYTRLMLRRWWVLAVLTLVGVGAGSVLSMVVQPQYVSQSSVLISMNGAGVSGGILQSNDVTTQRAATYASLGTSRFVLQAAATATGSNVEDLEGAVSVTPRDGQAFLDVTATGATAVQAQAWAQAVADRLVVAAAQSDQIGAGSGLALQVVTPASLPEVAVSPRPRNNILIGAAAGLIVGACGVVLWNALDTRIHSATDVRRSSGMSSVMVLPEKSGRSSEGRDAARAEVYHRLHATLRVAGLEAGPLTVAGVSNRVGIRDVTLGLGRAIASTGRTVVVVDIDARVDAGKDTGASGSEPDPSPLGLLDVLSGRTTVDKLLTGDDDGGLTLLPSGVATPGGVARLHTHELQRLVTGLTARFDCVLFACPPPGAWSPTLLMAAASSSTVLVARRSSSTTTDLADTLDVLHGVGVDVAHLLVDQ